MDADSKGGFGFGAVFDLRQVKPRMFVNGRRLGEDGKPVEDGLIHTPVGHVFDEVTGQRIDESKTLPREPHPDWKQDSELRWTLFGRGVIASINLISAAPQAERFEWSVPIASHLAPSIAEGSAETLAAAQIAAEDEVQARLLGTLRELRKHLVFG